MSPAGTRYSQLPRRPATAGQVPPRRGGGEAIPCGCARVCSPPAYVQRAAEYAAGRVAICTVIGFPNGYNAAPIKAAEATHAVLSGAAEIDMVVHLGWGKDGLFGQVLAEIQAVTAARQGRGREGLHATWRTNPEVTWRLV